MIDEVDKVLVLFVHGLGGSAKSWGAFERLLRSDLSLANQVDVGYFVYPTNIWNGWPLHRPVRMPALVNALLTDIEVRYARYKRNSDCRAQHGRVDCKKILSR